MKRFAKVALGALMLPGAATAVASSPADARVVVGFGVGGPGYYGGYYGPAYRPAYSCDPYSRWYDPYRCDYYAPSYYAPYYGGYYGPSVSFGFGGGFRDHDGWGGGFRGRDHDGGSRGGGGFRDGGHRR